MMANSRWRWLPNICLVWAHDGHMCILPNSLHRPMMAICIFYRQACIGPIQPIVYATIYTSVPIGGACVTADDIMMAKSVTILTRFTFFLPVTHLCYTCRPP